MIIVAIPVDVEGYGDLYRFVECDNEQQVIRAIQSARYGEEPLILKKVKLSLEIDDEEGNTSTRSRPFWYG